MNTSVNVKEYVFIYAWASPLTRFLLFENNIIINARFIFKIGGVNSIFNKINTAQFIGGNLIIH